MGYQRPVNVLRTRFRFCLFLPRSDVGFVSILFAGVQVSVALFEDMAIVNNDEIGEGEGARRQPNPYFLFRFQIHAIERGRERDS